MGSSPSPGVWEDNLSDHATEGKQGDTVINSWNNQVENDMKGVIRLTEMKQVSVGNESTYRIDILILLLIITKTDKALTRKSRH